MSKTLQPKKLVKERLVKLFEDRDIFEQLVKDNHISLTATNTMNLTPRTKSEYYREALMSIKNIIYGGQYKLSDYLSESLLVGPLPGRKLYREMAESH
ncbi:hypothetical protein HMPREF1544_03921 [Mucor circinelloides 1006PhL]|uniref:Uncharacterized protein n=1 Tax=Mucor circinelloides f. circinelloides (strain 1006PhL) TaxID=1220926 RepID=S2JG61_MUCC1|nr:hypothetical protein HMPREF1544_03921 [Mucor circinelloides 1006PhL]